MSTTVDKKVVEMQFDNKNFESNVQTSMSTIEKLKQALHFDGFADGLNRITSAAGRVDLSPLGDAADAVSSKFSALETMAVGALMRIGSNAVDAAGKLVKSLSIDQVTAGWNKYDEITKSTQTIMAATAKDWDNQEEQLEYVNKQLEKLNWFTDETSYNLSDMVNNISKFTSNGIALDKATTSMEGIATWAALSGAGIQEMSRAMYNISQATSVGYMSLIDWKSIQNANMATQEFKQTVIDTAEQMGTIKKGAVTIENFADNLSKGKWFTNDVLEVVLGKYGEFTDQLYELYNAFWDVGEEITTSQILDLLEEYKKRELDLAQVSDDTALSLDFLREAFDNLAASDMGLGEKGFRAAQEAKTFQEAIDATKDAVSTGWMNTFKIIFGDYLEAKRLWTDLANTMWDVFASGGEARNNLLAEWKALGGRDLLFANTEEDVGALWQLYNAFQSVAGPIHEAWEQIFPPITAERLVELTQKFKDFTERLKLSEKNQENLKKTFEGLFSVLKIGKQIISALLSPIKSVLGLTDGMGTTILGVTGSIGEWITKLANFTEENNIFGKAVDTIVGKIKMGWNAIKGFFTGLAEKWNLPRLDGVSNFFKTLKDGIKNIDFTSIDSFKESFKKLGQDLGSVPIFQRLRDGFGTVKNWTIQAKDAVVGAAATMKPVFQSVGNWFVDAYNRIKSAIQGESFQSRLKKLGDGLVTAKNVVINALRAAFEAIKGFNFSERFSGFSERFKGLGTTAGGVKDKIVAAIKTVVDYLKGADLKGRVDRFRDAFQKAGDKIKEIAQKIRDALATIFGGGKEEGRAASEGGSGGLQDILNLIATGGIVAVLTKFFNFLTGAKDTVKTIKEGFVDMMEAFTKQTKAMTRNLNAQAIKTLAISIAILAGSLFLMSKVPADQLAVAAGAMGVLVVELIGAVKKIKLFSKEMTALDKKQLVTMIGEMVAISLAMLALAIAIQKVGRVPKDTIKEAGVIVGILVAEMVYSFKLMSESETSAKESAIKNVAKMIAFARSIKVLSDAVVKLGKMDLNEILQGGAGITVLIGEVTGAMVLINKYGSSNMEKFAGNILAMSIALGLLSGVVKKIGKMDLKTAIQGAAGIAILMGELALFMRSMSGSFKDNADLASVGVTMVALSVGLGLLAGVMREFGNMPLEVIAVGLGTLAASLLLIVGVSKLVGESAAQLIILGYAMMEVGAASLMFGGAVALIGVGFALIAGSLGVFALNAVAAATAFVAAMGIITLGAIEALPEIMRVAGALIVGFCKVIEESAPAIKNALKAVLVNALQLFTESIPEITESILLFIHQMLQSIDDHVPEIVNLVIDILVKVFTVLRDRIPELIHVISEFLGALFDALITEIQNIDPAKFEAAAAAVGALVLLAIGAAKLLPLIPKAMLGIAGMALLVAEIAALFNALSFLDKIPGFEEGMDKGIDILTKVGEGLGKFVGAVVGGVAEGITSVLPTIGEHLAGFINNAQPFFDGLDGINEGALSSIKNLAEMLLVITAAELVERITNFAGGLLGNSSLESFGAQLAAFGPKFAEFASSISGVSTSDVEAAANASKMMAEVANMLPNLDGWAGTIMGDQSLETFGEHLAAFGPYLAQFGADVAGITPANVEAAASAAKMMAEVVNLLPNLGGVAGFLSGDQSLATFGEQLAAFGPKFASYAKDVSGISAEAINPSIEALGLLIDVATDFAYNSDGFAAFLGSSGLSSFGDELQAFGPKFKGYSDAVKGVNTAVIVSTTAAAESLSAFERNLPDHGGWVQKVTGDNSIAAFAAELLLFGPSFKAYADSVKGIKKATIDNSVACATALSELEANLPDVHGLMPWIDGTNTLAAFAIELELFGIEFAAYAKSVKDLDKNAVDSSVAAATALSTLEAGLPKVEGLKPWIEGKGTLSGFGAELANFGPQFAIYADSVKGIDIAAVVASSAAAESLSALQASLTKEGGVSSWFSGSQSFKNLANGLADFGEGLRIYADSVAGFSEDDAVSIGFSVKAAKALANMQSEIEKSGGKLDWFTGTKNFGNLASGLSELGEGLAAYVKQVQGLSDNDVAAVDRSATMARALADLQKAIVGEGGWIEKIAGSKNLGSFGETLVSIGQSMKKFVNEVKYLNHATITNTVNSINRIIDMCKNMTGSELSRMTGFSTGLESMANDGITKFVNAFDGAETRFREAAERVVNTFKLGITLKKSDFINEFKTLPEEAIAALRGFQQKFYSEGSREVLDIRDGANSKTEHLTLAFRKLAKASVEALRESGQAFYNAGANAAQGYIDGMNSRQSSVSNTSSNMARVSAAAARKELQIHSPSKVYYQIGEYAVEGYVKALDDGTFSVIQTLEDGTERSIDAFVKVLEDHTVVARDSGQAFGEAMENGILGALKKDAEIQEAVTNLALDTVSSPAWIGQGVFDATEDRLRELGLKLPEDSPAINNLLSGDSITTTITPVIDLTDAEEGAAELNEMLNGTTSINLADATGENLAKIIENQNEMLKAQNTIIDEINEFQEQFGGLSEKIENLRMYLDGDKLVGGLINRIDRALGQNEILAGRGM